MFYQFYKSDLSGETEFGMGMNYMPNMKIQINTNIIFRLNI